jgi:hypothetical protein
MLQNPAAVDAQGTQPASAGPRDPSLERIRSGLAEPPPLTAPLSTPLSATSPSGRPLFHVRVEGRLMHTWDWLDTGTPVPNYVRPTHTVTHHEFMLAVTPELFRGVAVHPYGVPVFSVGRAVGNAARGPLKRRKEAKARKEVAEALAAFEASIKQVQVK